jgi:hypothetical protein
MLVHPFPLRAPLLYSAPPGPRSIPRCPYQDPHFTTPKGTPVPLEKEPVSFPGTIARPKLFKPYSDIWLCIPSGALYPETGCDFQNPYGIL